MRRILLLTVMSVLVGALHLWTAAPRAAALDASDVCTLNPTGLSCPATYAPPALFNPGAVASATPEQAAAIHELELQAIANTLLDHGLPESDRAAVQSWGRYYALGELYSLVFTAIGKERSERTADEQLVVDWFGETAKAQAEVNVEMAAREYVKWAGLDMSTFEALIRDDASADALETFLSGRPEPYNSLDTDNATGGWCVYRAPAPYANDYVGWQSSPVCFSPCPAVCSAPTPSYAEFLKWGEARVSLERLSSGDYTMSQVLLAEVLAFGVTVASAPFVGLAVSAAVTATIDGATALSVFAEFGVEFLQVGESVTALTAEASGVASVAGTAIGGAVSTLMLAAVTIILGSIQFSDNTELPGKLAQLVVNTRTESADLRDLMGKEQGATWLATVFVGATIPVPFNRGTCDNSLIPPSTYLDGAAQNVFLPLGGGVHEITVGDHPCLNPPDIPARVSTDPHFVVTDQATGAVTTSPTITVHDDAVDFDATARIHGHWFIVAANGSTPAHQTLGLVYTDPDGEQRQSWLVQDASDEYWFMTWTGGADSTLDPDTCVSDGLCGASQTLSYQGPDGRNYEARVEPTATQPGSPYVLTANPTESTPVGFDTNGFGPAGAVPPVTYEWRFQKEGCGIPCTTVLSQGGGPGGGVLFGPSYEDPVTFADAPFKKVAHTWHTSGTYMANLKVTDSQGREAVTEFPVRVATVAPHLILSEVPVPQGTNSEGTVRETTRPGSPVTFYGQISHTGVLDNERIDVNWGDGSGVDRISVGPNTIGFPGPVQATATSPLTFGLTATHTYAALGTFYGTVTVVDNGRATDQRPFTYIVHERRTQSIDFAPIADQVYGEHLDLRATGGASGNPVTFAFGPASVCTQNRFTTNRLDLVGVGTCTVVAAQRGNDDFEPAGDAIRSFTVKPRPLSISAQSGSMTYGDPNPDFLPVFTGLVIGDSAGDIADAVGLTLTGPPEGSLPGSYPILISASGTVPNYTITYRDGTLAVGKRPVTVTAVDKTKVYGADDPAFTVTVDGLPDGVGADSVGTIEARGAPTGSDAGTYPITVDVTAANQGYDIRVVNGTETIVPAQLTVTADDKTKVYGAADPAFTASYDGLVNGDQSTAITGLKVTGAPTGSDVGTYPIVPSGATNPNYDIRFVNGTEMITPAPLRITATNTTVASGTVPSYDWTGSGWVNGDTDATLAQEPYVAPTCTAIVAGVAASATTPPGTYPGAITCAGAVDVNYAITYGSGRLTVDPVVTLDQSGLPTSVARQVTVDGALVNLPVTRRQMAYGTTHSWKYPVYVASSTGVLYVTLATSFSGPVVSNVNTLALYRAVRDVITGGVANGTINATAAKTLTADWATVEKHVQAGKRPAAQSALHTFASDVRARSGKKITKSTADDLLALAQAVYIAVGGAGPV